MQQIVFHLNLHDNMSTTPVSNISGRTTCAMAVHTYTLVLTFISCILSILGSFLIVFTFAKMPEIRNLMRKLLLALTVADFFTAVGNVTGSIRYATLMDDSDGCKRLQDSDIVCVSQSFVTTYSSMASFFWTTIIAVHIFLHVSQRSDVISSVYMLVGYSTLCYLIPGIIAITAASFDVLGSDNSVGTGSWCWIKSELDNKTQIIWMFLTGKLWEVLCYILTAGFYILSKLKLILHRRAMPRHHFNMTDIGDLRDEDENFLYVPFVLYILRIWGTVRFFLAITHRNVDSVILDKTQETLLALQSIGDSGQAFWNCVLFCFCDKTVRAYLLQMVPSRNRRYQPRVEPDERTPIQT